MKKVKVNLPAIYIKNLPIDSSAMMKAARRVVRSLKAHFKKDKWPVNYSFYVQEVFYVAYGHHLENYLLKEMLRQLKTFTLETGKHGDLVISVPGSKSTRPKSKKRRRK